MRKPCSIQGCDLVTKVIRKLCTKHYARLLRHGSPTVVFRKHGEGTTPEQKFWSRVDRTPGQGPNGDCWLWQGCRNPQGYGARIKYEGKSRPPTHLAWFFTHGVWPKQWLLHSCDNPPCVNPAHLRDGSPQENSDDRTLRQRVPKGLRHPQRKYTERQLRDACALINQGLGPNDIARRTGVNRSTVSAIRRGKEWQDLALEEGVL